MAVPVTEFVAGWNVVQTLGEGAFGEVKLLINQDTGEAVAMKIVDLKRHPDAMEAVRKEVCLHRMLKHKNIIKFFGSRKEEDMQYMFLEYAVGGELFDRIEPDIGMPQDQAQKYFKDLINGVDACGEMQLSCSRCTKGLAYSIATVWATLVLMKCEQLHNNEEYLHLQGVTHRDIKPENLLLDANDILKITDFGMATLFRYKGKERELDRKCGTKPYMAPEVLLRPYNAEPADIWSCGVVLVAFLAGELPWGEPTFSCNEYLTWKDKDSNFISESPWNKIDNLALSLLRKVLNTVPRYRATISALKSHSWVLKDFSKAGASLNGASGRGGISPKSKKRICSVLANSVPDLSLEDVSTRLACSQPDPRTDLNQAFDVLIPKVVPPSLSFSQPANPDHLLLSTQLSQGTQTCTGSQTPLQKLVRRMTRILVHTSLQDTLCHLETEFTKLNYSFKSNAANVLTITTVDRRGAQLVFKGTVLDMGPHILVDFRLSKGCGLDFKRNFLKIKASLSHILVKGAVTWSMALATNMLPA